MPAGKNNGNACDVGEVLPMGKCQANNEKKESTRKHPKIHQEELDSGGGSISVMI